MAYDAVAFLEGLTGQAHADERDQSCFSAVRPHDLPVEWWQLWDERAAIMEYDGRSGVLDDDALDGLTKHCTEDLSP